MAEGLVHISSLTSKGLKFDAGKQQLSNGEECYALGDSIEVVLNKIDLQQQKMDFTVFHSESKAA